MFRLIAVTLAALYILLLVFGDEERRPTEVTRAEPIGLSIVSADAIATQTTSASNFSGMSDHEAIEKAILAGKAIREERRATESKSFALATTVSKESVAEAEVAMSYWYVTGSLVNLRGGPGTSNAVVGQVTYGTQAEVLSDRDGWYEIRLSDGSTSGWIFGRFLNENLPG